MTLLTWGLLAAAIGSEAPNFFGDPFTWVMAGGVVLIGAGVLLLEYGSEIAQASG